MCGVVKIHRLETIHSIIVGIYRIDMIWTTSNIFGLTKKIDIIPRIKSDHNPIIWTGWREKKQFRWKLNEDLLLDEEYVKQIKDNTNHFFQINFKKDTKIRVIWDEFKAAMRSNLIARNAKDKKKKKNLKNKKIQEELCKKDLKRNPKKKKGKKEY